MKKTTIICLLLVASITSFSQSLSKEETIAYIKEKFVGTSIFDKCTDDVRYVTIIKNIEFKNNSFYLYDKDGNNWIYDLNTKYEATKKSDCSGVYSLTGHVNATAFVISESDAKALCKALNYLETISVDPFK